MLSFMLLQIARTAALVVTFGAAVRLDTCMNPFVLPQVTCYGERLSTMRAAVWSLASVESLMNLQETRGCALVVTL